MKKIIAIVFALVSISVYGQTVTQMDSLIYSSISKNVEKDDLSQAYRADYELVFATDMDAETMFKNLMSVVYKDKTAQTNKTDGKYQVTTTDTKYGTKYNIFIKDKKFKITAYLNSEEAYKYDGDFLYEVILKLPEIKIAAYARTILTSAEEKFDF